MYETIGGADMKAAEFDKSHRNHIVQSGIASGQNVPSRNRSETKFGDVISDGDGLCKLLVELIGRVDRIADIVDGPAPPVGTAPNERAQEDSLPDAINARFNRARAMVMHVHDTVSRIERRIG